MYLGSYRKTPWITHDPEQYAWNPAPAPAPVTRIWRHVSKIGMKGQSLLARAALSPHAGPLP
ncbi:hypothetical protein SXCC_01025 [Gluconacetobacter sp. SXCC-1]|nr:hypothetical protein SXCC_01025 [Gluconacetobacter sp. SXCC-1]